MSATRQYQTVAIGPLNYSSGAEAPRGLKPAPEALLGLGTVVELAADEEEEQQRQQGVHPHEADEGEERVAARTCIDGPAAVRMRP